MTILEHDILISEDLRRVPREELENRLARLREALSRQDPAWQLAVITDKLDMYYFTGTMQEGAFLVRPQDAILWVRRSLARALNESLLPEGWIRRMHSYRQPAECTWMKSTPPWNGSGSSGNISLLKSGKTWIRCSAASGA